jgi:hypothetical protein
VIARLLTVESARAWENGDPGHAGHKAPQLNDLYMHLNHLAEVIQGNHRGNLSASH